MPGGTALLGVDRDAGNRKTGPIEGVGKDVDDEGIDCVGESAGKGTNIVSSSGLEEEFAAACAKVASRTLDGLDRIFELVSGCGGAGGAASGEARGAGRAAGGAAG